MLLKTGKKKGTEHMNRKEIAESGQKSRQMSRVLLALAVGASLGLGATVADAGKAAGVKRSGPLLPAGAELPVPGGTAKTNMPQPGAKALEALMALPSGGALNGLRGATASTGNPRADLIATPEAWGTKGVPYTTARVAISALGKARSTIEATPVTGFPFRATGKLYFKIKGSTYVCTASLIKKGLLVTAAHCVFNYGKKSRGWFNNFQFVPALYNDGTTQAPYGIYTAQEAFVPTPYYSGTDTCASGADGIVCNNDLAVIVLNVHSTTGKHAGQVVGFYSYGYNGYGFVDKNDTALITQLGYPGAFDNGVQMIRTDSIATYNKRRKWQSVIMGSAQTGGSSGGPWLVNFGTRPVTDSSASLGRESNSNVVVAVTSWGYTSKGPKLQGASPFGQNKEYPAADYGGYGPGNIGYLVNKACTAIPSAC